jgi:hypothetical protein
LFASSVPKLQSITGVEFIFGTNYFSRGIFSLPSWNNFEIPEGLPVVEYLLGDPVLRGDDSNVSFGGRALIPHKGSLNEAVELWDAEGSSLLLLRYTFTPSWI